MEGVKTILNRAAWMFAGLGILHLLTIGGVVGAIGQF